MTRNPYTVIFVALLFAAESRGGGWVVRNGGLRTGAPHTNSTRAVNCLIFYGQSNAGQRVPTDSVLPVALRGRQDQTWHYYQSQLPTNVAQRAVAGGQLPDGAWGSWLTALDGVSGNDKTTATATPWAIFRYYGDGHAMATELRPGGTGYANFTNQWVVARQQFGLSSVRPVVRAIVLHQGEADATNATYAATYESNITNWMAHVRTDFATNCPIVLVRIAVDTNWAPYSATVRGAQTNAAASDGNAVWIDIDTLPRSDVAHLTDQGYYDSGYLIATGIVSRL